MVHRFGYKEFARFFRGRKWFLRGQPFAQNNVTGLLFRRGHKFKISMRLHFAKPGLAHKVERFINGVPGQISRGDVIF